jgi:chaperonin GroES
MSKIVAYGENVVVENLDEQASQTIIVPDSAKNAPIKGRVVAVGFGTRLRDGSYAPLKLAVGEVIVYSKYSVTDVEIDRKKYRIVAERDVLAVIQPEPEKKKKE